MLKAVIMAGGAGTRLWPLSRRTTPKYLLKLLGPRPLLAETVTRAAAELPATDIHVITPAEMVAEVRRAVPELPAENIIAEPIGRDSAACIGYAALRLHRADPDAVMLVLPVDHLISPTDRFWQAVRAGLPLAEESGNLVTFGVPADCPNTGLGYVQRGRKVAERGGLGVYELARFREKPDLETAERYLAAGDYYWNSGMFLWRAGTILDEIRTHMPGHAEVLKTIEDALDTADEDKVLAEAYPHFERISIDFGVMEKADNVFVVETDYDWDDVGTWVSVAGHHRHDDAGNVTLGDHVGLDTANTIIVSGENHTIGTVGVSDLIIVHTPDATLVARRDRAGDVKKLVAELKRLGRTELL